MTEPLSAGHTLVCTGCGEPVGYKHHEECDVGDGGVVLTSQAAEVEGQPRCRDCRQRIGRPHLCKLVGVVKEADCEPAAVLPSPVCKCGHRFDAHGANGKGPSACHAAACPCMAYHPEDERSDVAVRAEQVVRELTSAVVADAKPEEPDDEDPVPPSPVIVVQMHDDSPTTPSAVIRSIATEEANAAEIVIGVWSSGHVVVGKHRHGQAGVMDAAKVGPRITEDPPPEWPAKLTWGMYRDPATGATGPIGHPDELRALDKVYPDAEVEPYIPVRNLRQALTVLRNEADDAAEGAPLAAAAECHRGRACALDDALDLLKAATWEPGE